MKKETAQKLFLIILPVLAVALAATGNSVTVFQPLTSTTVYGSYFDLIPEAGNCQILPPLAACLALASLVLSILYLVMGKQGQLKGAMWTALLSAVAAAVPVVLDESVVVLPNVLLPLLMCAQAALAYTAGKLPKENQNNHGRKLERRL